MLCHLSFNRRKIICYAIWAVIASVYAALTYYFAASMTDNTNSDLFAHASGIVDIWEPEGFGAYFTHISYPGWHCVARLFMLMGFSLAQSAGLACAFFNFLTAVFVLYVSSVVLDSNNPWLVIASGIMLLFVTAVWLPPYNERIYYGQGSPTIWHSPTYLAVKPFALLSCLLLFRMAQDRNAGLKRCSLYAIITLLCLFLKPSFFQVQAPAIFIYLVIDFILNRDFKFVRNIALTFIPAVAYMLVELWIMFYSSTGGGEGIGFGFFTVYRFTNPSLLVSILLLLAFPIYSGIVLWKDLITKKSPYLFLVIMVVVGFCEYSFLLENGPRMYHGNFSWGYMLAVFLYWAFALPLFMKKSFVDKSLPKILVAIGCVLVLWHFVSGIIYYCELAFDPTGTMLF